MSFDFKCPECGVLTEAEDEWDGLDADCPVCNQPIIIKKPVSSDNTDCTDKYSSENDIYVTCQYCGVKLKKKNLGQHLKKCSSNENGELSINSNNFTQCEKCQSILVIRKNESFYLHFIAWGSTMFTLSIVIGIVAGILYCIFGTLHPIVWLVFGIVFIAGIAKSGGRIIRICPECGEWKFLDWKRDDITDWETWKELAEYKKGSAASYKGNLYSALQKINPPHKTAPSNDKKRWQYQGKLDLSGTAGLRINISDEELNSFDDLETLQTGIQKIIAKNDKKASSTFIIGCTTFCILFCAIVFLIGFIIKPESVLQKIGLISGILITIYVIIFIILRSFLVNKAVLELENLCNNQAPAYLCAQKLLEKSFADNEEHISVKIYKKLSQNFNEKRKNTSKK